MQAKIEDISFDKEDSLLFSYNDDLLLKAKAIQNSILPKLQVLLQESISLIRKIYEIEIFDEGSTLSKYPSFRDKRENDLKIDYKNAFVGICGNRLPIWRSMKRDDKKEVKILPLRYGFEINDSGLFILFHFDNQIQLSIESFQKLFSVFAENIDAIIAISNLCGFQLFFPQDKDFLFSSITKQIKQLAISTDKKEFEFYIEKYFSISDIQNSISSIPLYFAVIFPVYDSIIRTAKGENDRFNVLMKNLQDYIYSIPDSNNKISLKGTISESVIKESAEKKIDTIGIRASIRWQVFERDNFRCVACGASALDGAILHVDHILPRSKGGTDSMENYQTLCQTCNIGKSNKSEKNLRERPKT